MGRVTVPCIWDRVTERIVTNNYPDITIDFETQFTSFHGAGAPELYPVDLREEIDAVNAVVHALFARLDWLEARLSDTRYLVGGQLTEADVRLFTTLVRFDAVYVGHFKCNIRRLVDYPNLWGYARDLYQQPGFGGTVNDDHIKRHYYMTHDQLNPSRIVPAGPLIDWSTPHQRAGARLG